MTPRTHLELQRRVCTEQPEEISNNERFIVKNKKQIKEQLLLRSNFLACQSKAQLKITSNSTKNQLPNKSNYDSLIQELFSIKVEKFKQSSQTKINFKNEYIYYMTGLLRSKDELFKKYITNKAKRYKMHFIKNNIPIKEITEEQYVYLGRQEKQQKTLIFDLDETLLHCNIIDQQIIFNNKNEVDIKQLIETGINLRPYCREIILNLSKYFELLIFTASEQNYADIIIDFLDTDSCIKKRLYRQHCVQYDNSLFIQYKFIFLKEIYVKDLTILKDRNLKDIILVDNQAYSFSRQIQNGVPILPFINEQDDKELVHLEKYLLQQVDQVDVRELNNSTFLMQFYFVEKDPKKLLCQFFE